MTMPIQFYMNDDEFPPSPNLSLVIRSIKGHSHSVKGLIDTGADRTIIPDSAVMQLGLEPTGKIPIRGVNNIESELDTYFVSIEIVGTEFKGLIVAGYDEDEALIGRDLINLWRLEMDGYRNTVTIEPWSRNPSDLPARYPKGFDA